MLNYYNKDYLIGGILFGLIATPIYMVAPTALKFLLAGVVFLMVYSKRVEFFPGLILHLIPETLSMYGLLFGALFLTLAHHRLWIRSEFKWIYLIALIPLPFMAFHFYRLYIVEQEPLVVAVTSLGFYLSLFPFFYGLIIAPARNRQIIIAIIVVFIATYLIGLTGVMGRTIRIGFFITPFIFAFITGGLKSFKGQFQNMLKIIFLLVFINTLIGINAHTLTLILTSVFAVLIVYFKRKHYILLFNYLTSKWILVIGVALIVVVMFRYQDHNIYQAYRSLSSTEIERIENINDLVERFTLKAFSDRAPIWLGTFNEIVSRGDILPPIEIAEYEIMTIEGGKADSEIAAHNLILEILRQLGWLVGISISVVYVLILIKLVIALRKLPFDNFYFPFYATAFSIGFLGALVGQYPLLPSFSFLFITLFGFAAFQSNSYSIKAYSNGR